MRKFLKYAYVGAIALTGAGLASCSSDEDIDSPSGLTGETVKTAFTISVGDVTQTPALKQTANATQNTTGNFQGLADYIYIYPAANTITDGTALDLDKIQLAGFSAYSEHLTTAQGKVYTNVTIPVGTTDFLLYAYTAYSGEDKGALTPTYAAPSETTNAIKFDLVSLNAGKDINSVKTNDDGKIVTKLLNDIDEKLATSITEAHTASAAQIETILTQLREKLQYLEGAVYKPYAGSSTSIKAMVEDLYNSLKTIATNYPSTATTYIKPITDVIEASFTATETEASGVYTLAWKTTDPNFPFNAFKLPDGAVTVQYDGSKFEYVQGTIEGLNAPEIATYTEPAQLYYTINSKGMVRNSDFLTTSAADGKKWDEINVENSYYKTGAVTATTKSIILKDQAQYAVARLDVQVKAGSAKLEDKKEFDIDVPASGYPVTGILVGGQKQVDWKFQPVTSASEMTIYDRYLTGIYAPTSDFGAKNSTLVLETAATAKINVAVEFENTGEDFFGVDGQLIPSGTKFYLIAQLDPDGKDPNQVFKQDYVTLAKLTINDLKKAYNIVPDLRTPKLEFGFSVNLEWIPGATYEINL